MEQGRLGANGTTRRRASGRAARKPGSSDPELSAAGREWINAGDLEDEAQRAAGGPGLIR